jgi:DNA-binding transcriptional LysR family regulator
MDWRSIQFDWNHARAFLVTAEEGSFSAAARALGTSQPTLGRQVTALEAQLGVSLFERVGGGLQITSSGYELLEHVRTMADAANSLSLFATGRAETIAGKVCISAVEVVGAFVLPPIIAKLRILAPNVEIELIASNDTSDLMRREADIAIRAFQPVESNLIARKIRNINGHIYGATSYLAAIKERKEPKDLASLDFLAFGKSEVMISDFSKYGFNLTPGNFPISVKNHLVQWELVKQGLGLGFMLEDAGDKEVLVERALPHATPFVMESWLVVHRELHTSRKIRVVFDLLAAELA